MKMTKKWYSDLTPQQVRERLIIWFFGSLVLFWFISTLYWTINEVSGNAIQVEKHQKEPENKKIDENLENNKPTDRRRLNSNGYSQKYVVLNGSSVDERAAEMLSLYNYDWNEIRRSIITISRVHRVKPEMFLCIMYADSSIWRFLKSKNNPGNVWNNDRWDTVDFETMEQWIDAIWRYALNGTHLKSKYTVDYLSPALWKPGPYYATSSENRHVNVTNCLWMIHNKYIEDNRNFRF